MERQLFELNPLNVGKYALKLGRRCSVGRKTIDIEPDDVFPYESDHSDDSPEFVGEGDSGKLELAREIRRSTASEVRASMSRRQSYAAPVFSVDKRRLEEAELDLLIEARKSSSKTSPFREPNRNLSLEFSSVNLTPLSDTSSPNEVAQPEAMSRRVSAELGPKVQPVISEAQDEKRHSLGQGFNDRKEPSESPKSQRLSFNRLSQSRLSREFKQDRTSLQSELHLSVNLDSSTSESESQMDLEDSTPEDEELQYFESSSEEEPRMHLDSPRDSGSGFISSQNLGLGQSNYPLRNVLQPVNHWRGDQLIYDDDGNLIGCNQPHEPSPAHAKAQVLLPTDVQSCVVFDNETGLSKAHEVVFPKQTWQFSAGVHKVVETRQFELTVLHLEKLSEASVPASNSIVCTVLRSDRYAIDFQLGEQHVRLSTWDTFIVPKGSVATVYNRSPTRSAKIQLASSKSA